MKANELRIGNLINRQDYICKVTKIEEGGIITEPLEYKGEMFVKQGVEPIPLTEEWLVKFGFDNKFGFKKQFGESYEEGTIIFEYYFNTEELKIFQGYGGGDGGYIKIKCKYVHQLQNLYFALTGEELTIG